MGPKTRNIRALLRRRVAATITVLRWGLCLALTLVGPKLSVAFAQDSTEQAFSLSVAQLNWCPQICPRGEAPGYIIDIVREVFENTNFSLNYQTMSYPIARGRTKRGDIDALLAPAKIEAPSLIYPNEPIGYQRVCFYTPSDSRWIFDGEDSLQNLTIGIAIDMSLEEIHDYIQTHEQQFVFQAESKRYIQESLRMLEIGRLDTFVFNENSVLFYMRKQGWNRRIRNAGCVSSAPVYMAFTPVAKDTEKLSQAIHLIDTRVRRMRKNGEIAKIMARYGLPDWSKF